MVLSRWGGVADRVRCGERQRSYSRAPFRSPRFLPLQEFIRTRLLAVLGGLVAFVWSGPLGIEFHWIFFGPADWQSTKHLATVSDAYQRLAYDLRVRSHLWGIQKLSKPASILTINKTARSQQQANNQQVCNPQATNPLPPMG